MEQTATTCAVTAPSAIEKAAETEKLLKKMLRKVWVTPTQAKGSEEAPSNDLKPMSKCSY
eukprot:6464716-Amphidinium_carterae.2